MVVPSPSGIGLNEWDGVGTIQGTVKIGATPASRKVRLFVSRTSMLVRETWSDANGNYSFQLLNTSMEFDIISMDYQNVYNHVIAARVKPV